MLMVELLQRQTGRACNWSCSFAPSQLRPRLKWLLCALLQPSAALRRLSSGLLHASNADIGHRQVLEHVTRQVREVVNFVIAEPDGMRYLDRVDTECPLRVQLPVGSRVPLPCTASGKTYLASLLLRERIFVIASLPLDALTAQTITTTNELLEETAKIAERGYTIDNEESMEGLIALAVPVCDNNGRFVAALAFHALTQRISIERVVNELAVLRDGAERLCASMLAE